MRISQPISVITINRRSVGLRFPRIFFFRVRYPMALAKKTVKERFLHAFFFEIIAIGLCEPVVAWALNKPFFEMGLLTMVIAWIALAWNMMYNAGFERIERHMGWRRLRRPC